MVFLAYYSKYGLLPANDVIRTGEAFITAADAKRVIDLSGKAIR